MHHIGDENTDPYPPIFVVSALLSRIFTKDVGEAFLNPKKCARPPMFISHPPKKLSFVGEACIHSRPLIFPKPKMTQIKNATFSSARRASALGSSWDLLELLNKSEILEISIPIILEFNSKNANPESLTVWSQILRLASKMTPYSLVTGIMGILGCCSQEISSIPTNLPLFPT